MKSDIKKHGGKRKGAGRPRTGQMPFRGIRLPAATDKAVLEWAKKQPDRPSFVEAVRRLLAKALGL